MRKQPFRLISVLRLPVQSALEVAVQVSLVNTTRPPALSVPELQFSHVWNLMVALAISAFWHCTRSLGKQKWIHFVIPEAKSTQSF